MCGSLAFSALAIAVVVGSALAEKFEPRVGQAGKDVVWVPTPQALVDRMLDMAKVMPGDFLMDLGSGDGRTVITAAKRGVRAMGVEFNPNMVNLARETPRPPARANLRLSRKATCSPPTFPRRP